jgi:hypothetical protein
VKENEIVVVGKSDHQPRRCERTLLQEIPHRGSGRLQHAVQLFPAVNLLHLGVAVEIEVEDYELATILDGLPDAVNCRGDGGEASERVAQ